MSRSGSAPIGVLALQGASRPHHAVLAALGAEARDVRAPRDLEGLTHLILPGGESTTIDHLLRLFGLRSALEEAIARGRLAVFGTCAGAILLGRTDQGAPKRPPRFGVLDADLARNAYGRQVDSFAEDLELEGIPGGPMHCVFIRAPRITRVGADVTVLGRRLGEPILVAQGALLAATFHPELAGDVRIHRLFLEMRATRDALPGTAAGVGRRVAPSAGDATEGIAPQSA